MLIQSVIYLSVHLRINGILMVWYDNKKTFLIGPFIFQFHIIIETETDLF